MIAANAVVIESEANNKSKEFEDLKEKLRKLEMKLHNQEIKSQDQNSQLQNQQSQLESQQSKLQNQNNQLQSLKDQLVAQGEIIQSKVMFLNISATQFDPPLPSHNKVVWFRLGLSVLNFISILLDLLFHQRNCQSFYQMD